jgi:membrane protease YdiL (CAAX protease family)
MIDADGLMKRYDEVTAVDGVSLSVEPGAVYGFFGPNSAGKTTTIELLTAMTEPTAGTATVAGLDGFAGFVSAFLGGYAGMAAVVVGYLLLADRCDYLDISIPTRADLRMVILVASGLLAAWLAVTVGARTLGLPFAEHALGGTASGPAQLAAIIALVLLVNAPVEEAPFRNVVQKRLGEALSRRGAMAIATLAFGLVHVPAYAGAGAAGAVLPLALVTVAGPGFAVVYDRTANLPAAALWAVQRRPAGRRRGLPSERGERPSSRDRAVVESAVTGGEPGSRAAEDFYTIL